MSNKTPIWMPYEEYRLQQELFAKLEPEIIMKMNYYFWNNFSYEGYEEWKLQNQNKINESINKS